MSGISGKIRENQNLENTKKVGLFAGKVIAVNPTEEEYKDLLGITLPEDSKATEYLKESKEGNQSLRLNIWVEDKKGFKSPVTFFLEQKQKENKEGTKKQYINELGACSWAESENSLPDWFKKKPYRVAFVGEEELYNFLRTWLGNLDYRDPETTLSLDWKKLIKGNVSEIKAQIDGPLCTPVGCLAIVKTIEKEAEDGTTEIKQYQGIYNRMFLPEYALKQFRMADYQDETLRARVRAKAAKDQKIHEKFVAQVTGEYGCKDFYILKDLRDYEAGENPVSSPSPVLNPAGTDDLPF